jgi:hypothetical protein
MRNKFESLLKKGRNSKMSLEEDDGDDEEKKTNKERDNFNKIIISDNFRQKPRFSIEI